MGLLFYNPSVLQPLRLAFGNPPPLTQGRRRAVAHNALLTLTQGRLKAAAQNMPLTLAQGRLKAAAQNILLTLTQGRRPA